ncbi:hypothetical protein Sjap_014560 [Stephania japonica]|uniref:Uncharacterized protein n=1 Tax=Stephania japonica TaxID=461633 RepID=A0AAP0NQJ6_9MAGN
MVDDEENDDEMYLSIHEGGGGGGGTIKARAAASLPPTLHCCGWWGSTREPHPRRKRGVGAPLGGSSFPPHMNHGEEREGRGGSPPFLRLDGGRTEGRWPSGQPPEASRRRRPEGPNRGELKLPSTAQQGEARASSLFGQLLVDRLTGQLD